MHFVRSFVQASPVMLNQMRQSRENINNDELNFIFFVKSKVSLLRNISTEMTYQEHATTQEKISCRSKHQATIWTSKWLKQDMMRYNKQILSEWHTSEISKHHEERLWVGDVLSQIRGKRCIGRWSNLTNNKVNQWQQNELFDAIKHIKSERRQFDKWKTAKRTKFSTIFLSTARSPFQMLCIWFLIDNSTIINNQMKNKIQKSAQ